MKGIASTGAPKIHVPGWMDGWMDGWVGVKAVLRIVTAINKYLVIIQSEFSVTCMAELVNLL
jgi:hypothetical protein